MSISDQNPSYNPTERIGVNAVEGIFLKDFEWIFREQPISDTGIDAHVEIVLNGAASGKLIALQIKTGESHFNINDTSLTYYGNLKHLDYWLNHSLTVLLIAHLPNQNKTYWQIVNLSTIEHTSKAWKIEIPKSQELSKMYYDTFLKFAHGTKERDRRLKLLMDRPIMDVIKGGGKVSVEFIEWLHKSLGRTVITLFIKPVGQDEYVENSYTIFFGRGEPLEVIKMLFPWAVINNDNEYYKQNFDKQSLSGMYRLLWLITQPIYPYKVQQNEVANYRLQLTLNELGRGYLTYLEFIEEEEEIDWIDNLPEN